MTPETWNAVDEFLAGELLPRDPILEGALERSARAGLPSINVSPNLGRLLNLLARLQGAQRILEIGTLGGYSTIWLARALPPGGILITLEADAKHAEVARQNIEAAGLDEIVDVRLGRALDTLPLLDAEGAGPFDVIFIDADKPSNADYLTWALRLTRRGSLIILDNVVRGGAVIDANGDAGVQGVRRALALLAAEPRVDTTALQTVGIKGYDGIAIALVTADA